MEIDICPNLRSAASNQREVLTRVHSGALIQQLLGRKA